MVLFLLSTLLYHVSSMSTTTQPPTTATVSQTSQPVPQQVIRIALEAFIVDYDPSYILLVKTTGQSEISNDGSSLTFLDSSGQYIGEVTWYSSNKLPDNGVYSKFYTSQGKRKVIKIGDFGTYPTQLTFISSRKEMKIFYDDNDTPIAVPFKGSWAMFSTTNRLELKDISGSLCFSRSTDWSCVEKTDSQTSTPSNTQPATDYSTAGTTRYPGGGDQTDSTMTGEATTRGTAHRSEATTEGDKVSSEVTKKTQATESQREEPTTAQDKTTVQAENLTTQPSQFENTTEKDNKKSESTEESSEEGHSTKKQKSDPSNESTTKPTKGSGISDSTQEPEATLAQQSTTDYSDASQGQESGSESTQEPNNSDLSKDSQSPTQLDKTIAATEQQKSEGSQGKKSDVTQGSAVTEKHSETTQQPYILSSTQSSDSTQEPSDVSTVPDNKSGATKDSSDESTDVTTDSSGESTDATPDSSDESTDATKDSSDESTDATTDSSGESTDATADSSGESTDATTDSSGESSDATADTTSTMNSSVESTDSTTDSSGESTDATKDSNGKSADATTDSSGKSTDATTDSSRQSTDSDTTTDSSGQSTDTTSRTNSSGESTDATTDSSEESTDGTKDSSWESTDGTKDSSWESTDATTDPSGESTDATTDSSGELTDATADSSEESTDATTDSSGESTDATADSSGESTDATKQAQEESQSSEENSTTESQETTPTKKTNQPSTTSRTTDTTGHSTAENMRTKQATSKPTGAKVLTPTGFTVIQPDSSKATGYTTEQPESSKETVFITEKGGVESSAPSTETSEGPTRPTHYVSRASPSREPTTEPISTEESLTKAKEKDFNFKCQTVDKLGNVQVYEIERSMVCDGVVQCSDASDEMNCPVVTSPRCRDKTGLFYNMTHFGMCRNSFIPITFASNVELKHIQYGVVDLTRKADVAETKQNKLENSQVAMETRVYTHELKLGVVSNEVDALKETMREMEREMEHKAAKQIEMLLRLSEVIENMKVEIERLKEEEKEEEEEKCKEGEVQFEKQCYVFVQKLSSYAVAESYCQERNQRLATWSRDQEDVQRQLVEAFGSKAAKEVWIGYKYSRNTGKFIWCDNTQYDMRITRGNAVTACGALYRKIVAGFKCKNERSFICRYDLSK